MAGEEFRKACPPPAIAILTREGGVPVVKMLRDVTKRDHSAVMSTPAELEAEARRNRAQRRRQSLAGRIQAHHANGSKLHSDTQAVNARPLSEFDGDDYDEDAEFDRIISKGTSRMSAFQSILKKVAGHETVSQGDVHNVFLEKADELRIREPALTPAAAYAKVYTAAENADLRKLYAMTPNVVPFVAPIAKRESTGAMKELEDLADEERRKNPKLTKAQAFSKVYTNPGNAPIVKRYREETWTPPPAA